MLPGGVQPGFFRNKIVFIGARPMVGAYREKRDELRSPYTSSSGEFLFMPMVEVHATQFLNLLRGDRLRRLHHRRQRRPIIALTAIIFGFGFLRLRPLVATGMKP